jgi:hypothetical protein
MGRGGLRLLLLLAMTGGLLTHCGGTVGATADAGGTSDAAGVSPEASAEASDGATVVDAATSTKTDSGHATSACVPGQSIGCIGPGGCSTNQVCSSDGSGFGPCDCASTDASTTPGCVPGQSIACAGPGGCISSQVCNAAGAGYGACVCGLDAGALLCIPGQSISCAGPLGCVSFQVCDATGDGYGPCECPDGAVPDSGSVECQTANDCETLLGPLPVFCDGACPGAPNGGCLHYLCVYGICQATFCGQ